MNHAFSVFDPVDELVDGFLERYRRGERPSLSEYAEKHPELAERIRALFPALLVMEELGSRAGGSGGSVENRSGPSAKVPERLGDYVLLRRIGSGGMGVVYEAIQESLGRHVALKTLPFHQLGDATRLERFRREARAAARLHHTHIVPVFGVGEHDGLHYYIMQFIRGQGLDSVLREVKRLRRDPGAAAAPDPLAGHALSTTLSWGLCTGRFQTNGLRDDGSTVPDHTELHHSFAPAAPASPSQSPGPGHRSELTTQTEAQYSRSVARLGGQVAEALEYAHQQGILHRDIKPSNLLLDAQGQTWVTDFGLAKDQDSDELTRTGDIVGTISYMAPERFRGKCDVRSDIYGLGLTLYELVALRPAYEAADRHTLIERVLHQGPPRLRTVAPTVPRDLETIIQKAIDRDPLQRYATAAALAEDLQRFLEDKPIRARQVSQTERFLRWCRRNRALAALLGAVTLLSVLITAGSSAVTLWVNREHQRTRAAFLENRHTLYAAQIHLAHRAWEDAHIDRAEEILADHPFTPGGSDEPDLRGWEWHYLRGLCRGQELTLKAPKTGLVNVAFSPDGHRLAAAGWDGQTCLWNLRSDDPACAILSGHWFHVNQVAFSPDGHRLASASSDGTVRLWEVETGRAVRSLTMRSGAVRTVAFSPDGRRLASAGEDRLIHLWDPADGRELRTIAAHDGQILCVAFSPDGRRLVSCGQDRKARSWDVESARPLRTFAGHLNQVSGVAFSPDGRTLATSSEDATVRLWDAETGVERAVLKGHETWVLSVVYSPDGRLLASASDDGTVRLWDAETGAEVLRLRGHIGRVCGVAFHPAGRYLASSGQHGIVKLWDLAAGRQEFRVLRGHASPVTRVAFGPGGRALASASRDSTLRLWDLASGRERLVLRGTQGEVWGLAYSPDGRRLASAGDDSMVRLWDAETGRLLLTMKGHTGPARTVAFHPHGRRVASSGTDATVRIWDELGQPLKVLSGHAALVRCLAYSPDGRQLASASKDGTVRVWDSEVQGQPRVLLGASADLWTVRFSPDGRLIAASGADGVVTLWGAESGRVVRSIPAHQGIVTSLAFSPDGHRLVTIGFDRRVKVWDTATGRETLNLKREHPHYDVSFDPAGERIAIAGVDSAITLYESDPRGQSPHARLPLAERSVGPTETETDPKLDPILLGPDAMARARYLVQQGRWGAAETAFDEAVGARPDSTATWMARGGFRLARGQPEGAAADLVQALRLEPVKVRARYLHALLLLALGDQAGLRRACSDSLSRFGNTTDPFDANNIAWSCLLGPDAVADREAPVRLAERAVSGAPETMKPRFLYTLGAALCRAGRFEEAIGRLEESIQKRGGESQPQDWAFLAMAHHQLGHCTEARRWLDRLQSYRANEDFDASWDELEIRILRSEAEALVLYDPVFPSDPFAH